MKGTGMRLRITLVLSLLFVVLAAKAPGVVANRPSGFESQFKAIVAPYTFNFAAWEVRTLAGEIKDSRITPPSESEISSRTVTQYFSYLRLAEKLRADLRDIQSGNLKGDFQQIQTELAEVVDQENALRHIAEITIERQVGQALADAGIFNPLVNGIKLAFPPVNFKLEKSLYVLVVSPRDKIDRIKDVTLVQDLTPARMETMESQVDSLNVSSLVIPIGGLGATFPSFVEDQADLKWALETVAHEWLHQYLAFKPLGFRYVLDLLGISSQPDIETINETVANIAGQEIGDAVYAQYYAQAEEQPAPVTAVQADAWTSFDFNAAMRETRQRVDSLLAGGQVDAAEAYMARQQQMLASHGYSIRKLNQAYFAFYGSYADSPTSVDPLGSQLKTLRQQSSAFVDFLNQVSGFTSRADVQKALK
jgi:hypothetical protein